MTMTIRALQEVLGQHGIHPDQVSKSKGEFIIRKGFFYRHGGSAEKWEDTVMTALSKAGLNFAITDSGEVWKDFKGGASVARQSHWYVKLVINDR